MNQEKFSKKTAKDYNFCTSLKYYFILYFIVYVVGKLFYNVKIVGRENLEKHKKYLYAPNHVSFLDPPLTCLAAKGRIAFMAKHELFTDKSLFIRTIIKNCGAFAVNRDKPEISTFRTVLEILKTNWSLGICPQGKIEKGKEITVIQKGFTTIAKKAKSDIVPIGVCGFEGYCNKLFGGNITIKVGKPISYELDDNEIIKQWVEQICEMTGSENKLNID